MKINSIMAKNMINAYSKQKQYVKADIGNKQLKDKVEISEDAKYLSKINNDNENINLDKVDEVLKDEMLEEIKRVDDYNHACDKLILLAKSRGGRDNITVLLFGGEV